MAIIGIRRMETEQRYGNYRVVSLLGRGGTGVVYAAEHVHTRKRVAIKVLLPELSRSREIVARFFHEARSTANIQDSGIAEVFDSGYDAQGNAYFAMELLQGESLGARLARGQRRQPLEFLVTVGQQIARIVGAAHAAQVIHRDLKPDNIFLVSDHTAPQGFHVKVLDFGMAKLSLEGGPITEKGALLGTPLYMSPEQCRGLGDIDARTDIYSLGCMLYELAVGHPPFVRGGVGVIIGSHIYEPVPRPRDIAPDVPPALEALLLRTLAKDPDERPQTMRELAFELARLGGQHDASGRASR